MTTETLTLADFLLARIAEGEAVAREAIAQRDSISYAHPPTVPDLSMQAWEDVGVPAVLVGPERVLSECEAKRRIVTRESYAWPKIGAPPYNGPLNDIDSGGRHPDLVAYIEKYCEPVTDRPVLRILAAVYADHPDYDETWRP